MANTFSRGVRCGGWGVWLLGVSECWMQLLGVVIDCGRWVWLAPEAGLS